MGRLFTSESVTEGHPDKIADKISDAILDALIAQDKNSRVAAETTVATGLALIVGEISTNAYVDIAKIARDTIREIGYTGLGAGFDADSIAVLTSIDEQSADIALGVDKALEQKITDTDEDFGTGAGDQGIIFGYATNETLAFYLIFVLTERAKLRLSLMMTVRLRESIQLLSPHNIPRTLHRNRSAMM